MIKVNKDDKKIVDKYITFPFVIENMENDLKFFKGLKMGLRIIEELNLESVLQKIKGDYYLLKNLMRVKHGLDVRKISTLQYVVNGVKTKYTSKEVKNMTEQLMMEYINKK